MVGGCGVEQAGAMTEEPPHTPPDAPPSPPFTQPSTQPSVQPSVQPPPRSGWNTDNLKDYRALRRSRGDRKVAGVAGGLGRHLDVDPTVLRVLFVVLVFFGGAGILLYGALWLFVPEEDTGDAVVSTSDSTRNALLIAAAVLAGLMAVGDSWGGGFGFPWPVALLGLVVAAVLLTRDNRSAPPSDVPTHEAAWTTAPGAPDTGAAWQPPVGGYVPVPPFEATAAYAPTPPPPGPSTGSSAADRKRGPLLFGPTLALVALALGALGLYDATGGSVADAAYPALALAVIGSMLVVGAFVGRAGGLVFLGLLAAVALPATALGAPTYDGDRDLFRRPVTAAQLEDSLSVPAGRITVDLTAVGDLEELDDRVLSLDANAGEIVVVVPDGLRVAYLAEVRYGGAVESPDSVRGGWNIEASGVVNPGAAPELTLDADLGFGRVEVRQP
jgi:phage shock protein PspC (stress-responsive transcriptional regulator)